MSRFAFWIAAARRRAPLRMPNASRLGLARAETSVAEKKFLIERDRERARDLARVVPARAVGDDVQPELWPEEHRVLVLFTLLPDVGRARDGKHEGKRRRRGEGHAGRIIFELALARLALTPAPSSG